ncbi:MAG: metallophosphoesterase family protein [Acidimicrobiia bacterium]|nr:metallophosphoesterase family protein [Acidimicrobiia bacterium]
MTADHLSLPGSTTACFVGDLHLGDGGRNEVFRTPDARLVELLEDGARRYDAIVFMGDAVDLAQGWSTRRVLAAHPAVAAAIASAAARTQVVFVRGNHDWNVDYEAAFPAARACVTLELGDVLVQHGHQYDALCEPHTRSYQRQMVLHHLAERALGFEFRTPLHEHYSWQNRAAHWLGHRYGRHRAASAERLRRRGLDERAEARARFVAYWSRSVWGDPHDAFRPIRAALHAGPHRAIVCGHTHLAGLVDVDGRHYVNAGSWTFGAAEAAVWDGTGFRVHDAVTGRAIGDESYRWLVEGVDPGDFFDWWAQHYRGRLRFGAPISPAESRPRGARHELTRSGRGTGPCAPATGRGGGGGRRIRPEGRTGPTT